MLNDTLKHSQLNQSSGWGNTHTHTHTSAHTHTHWHNKFENGNRNSAGNKE